MIQLDSNSSYSSSLSWSDASSSSDCTSLSNPSYIFFFFINFCLFQQFLNLLVSTAEQGFASQLQQPATPPFTQEDVQQLLGMCKPGKALGPDGIPTKMLKLSAMELLSPTLYFEHPTGQRQYPPKNIQRHTSMQETCPFRTQPLPTWRTHFNNHEIAGKTDPSSRLSEL